MLLLIIRTFLPVTEDGDNSDKLVILLSEVTVSPVLLAFEYNSLSCLEYLLQQHKDSSDEYQYLDMDEVSAFIYPPEQDMAGKNAFHVLAMRERADKMLEILDKHENYLKDLKIINKGDKTNATPLLFAVKRNNREIAKYLIERGADFELRDNYNQSPIKVALMEGQEDVVREMLKKGM